MRKEFLVDLHSVTSKLELMNRFVNVLNLNPWNKGGNSNWDAFDDVLASLYFEDLENDENPEVHLVITGSEDIKKNISVEVFNTLKDSLDKATDSSQRIDKYKFSYEIKN